MEYCFEYECGNDAGCGLAYANRRITETVSDSDGITTAAVALGGSAGAGDVRVTTGRCGGKRADNNAEGDINDELTAL